MSKGFPVEGTIKKRKEIGKKNKLLNEKIKQVFAVLDGLEFTDVLKILHCCLGEMDMIKQRSTFKKENTDCWRIENDK